MRATERLLQVVQESASEILQGCEDPAKEAGWILEATRELRRRGDTLVRRDDVAAVLPYVDDERPGVDRVALERLDTAVGGVL